MVGVAEAAAVGSSSGASGAGGSWPVVSWTGEPYTSGDGAGDYASAAAYYARLLPVWGLV